MKLGHLLALAAIVLVALVPERPWSAEAERGAYLVRAAGCISCHTDKAGKGPFLAGGRAIVSPYGNFYSSNITPDAETGIGAWSDADFIQALSHGESPTGRTYYPAFPYASYSAMRREDMLDIKAYLFAQTPVRQENRGHELRFPFSWRFSIYPWRWLFFSSGEFDPDGGRGAYLVEVLGHCAECHTPRNMAGGLKRGRHLAGTRYGPDGHSVPNITPDSATGIGNWSEADIVFFFKTGLKPDGDDVQGHMRETIEDGLSHLSDEDLTAIADYLKAQPAIRQPVRGLKPATATPSYDEW